MTDTTWQDLEAAREIEELFDQRAVTAQWLGQQTFPPLEWIVEGILPEGMGLIVAPPKAGKSWWVANVALACSAGGYALGKVKVKPRPVLYMALEDGHRRMQSRLRQLHGDDGLPAGLAIITQADQDEALLLIDEFLRRHQADAPLVIVDTLGKIKPAKRSSEESYQADYRIGSALKDRVDAVSGACLLLVHHTRKAESADFIDAVSGTQGIAGSADFVLVLARKRKATDAVLAVTGRDVIEAEYALQTEDGNWSLSGMDLLDSAAIAEQRQESQSKGDRTMAALAFVNSRTETKAADLAGQLMISADDAGRYLRRLSEDGHIRKSGRGLFTPVSEVSGLSERGIVAGHDAADSQFVSDTLRTVSETDTTSVQDVDQGELALSDTSDTSDTDPKGSS